jgi:poly-gamma-glutamate capsule biosynthesis protein CapA/YwtB (metallophosphatase superfamily)
LKGADITFGNIEGSISDDAPLAKQCKNPAYCYAFRMPEKYGKCLKDNGFDVLSLANNHIGDFGEQGKQHTMQVLDSLGMEYAGLTEKPVTVFTRDSIVYGFCAFSPNPGTASIHSIENAQQLVADLDKRCDIVIVSFHGGAEGSKYQHVTRKTEIFLGENRGNVYLFAHKMIDAGADVVFGHGPHVTRAIEVYNKRFIIYSLGNFATYGRFNLAGVNGIAPIVKVEVSLRGEFIKGKIISAKQTGKGITQIDENNRAVAILQQLTKQDFPELKIKITDNGEIIIP